MLTTMITVAISAVFGFVLAYFIFKRMIGPITTQNSRQKKQIDQQIAELKNRTSTIAAITANMREGLILLDSNGMVLIANKSVLDIFGISQKSDILRKNILHTHRDVELQRAVDRCLLGEHLEFVLHRADKIYSVHLNPAPGGAVLIFLDITQQHKAEAQRRELSANVSHELKTPLTSISALSEMIASGMAKPADVPDFAAKILTQSSRLLAIIEDIIRLSKFDEGRVEPEFEPFDLHDLAKSVLSNLQGLANKKNVSLSLHGENIKINANPRLIDELLYNLVENGIKYNENGGNVVVDLEQKDGQCKITVADTGIGIPATHYDRIFQRFYRVDSSRSKDTGGTGLGLAIAKHITEHHGGRITLESAENQGTTVTAYIPM